MVLVDGDSVPYRATFLVDEETKMEYDFENKSYTVAILMKQGFYNYTFATIDNYGSVNTNEVNGTFFQTENEYKVITYFKPFGGLYDRVIGVGTTFFDQNR